VKTKNHYFSRRCQQTIWAGILAITFSHCVCGQQPPDSAHPHEYSELQQTSAGNGTAPQNQQSSSDNSPTQHKTVAEETVGVLSRRSIFFPDLATDRCPLKPEQKFKLFVDQTIAPSTFVSAAGVSGFRQALDSYPGYGQGWDGYEKRFGAAVANSASTNFFGTYLFPSLLHEDPRHFFTLRGGFEKKLTYSLTRQVITRTDDGRKTFNWSRVLSVFAAEGLANLYLPPEERTAGRTSERIGMRFGSGVGINLVKEYWPIIFRKLGLSGGNSSNSGGQP
jgi:hypothetical protein